jgi:N4-gp56 family major capsid protein
MPILRYEQFAVKKTELAVAPGMRINFLRYKNFSVDPTPLTEGVRITTNALTSEQIAITVAEHAYATSVSELLLNASFDDVMASASRLLGRHMAQYLDTQARDTLNAATSAVFAYDRTGASGANDFYNEGDVAASLSELSTDHKFSPGIVKDAVLTLSSKNIPRLGETYVAFIAPQQSRAIRSNPEFIETTKYAAPGNFLLGEVGRLYDTVFIETTQVKCGKSFDYRASVGVPSDQTGIPVKANTGPGQGGNPAAPGATAINGTTTPDVYQATMIGDNAFGHAIALPVELRDGGVLDFGREHSLAWYAIWGLGIVTDQAIVSMFSA